MDASERAYERVIRILAGRSHSRAELMRKLRQRGVGKVAAEQAVERATSEGYVDDGRFALEFTRHGQTIKGWAPARVRQELAKRGVDRELVDVALNEVFADVDLLEQATRLAQARAARLSGDTESRRRRLVGYLERRGFSTSVCRAAADAVAPL
jgi:regulatory protein